MDIKKLQYDYEPLLDLFCEYQLALHDFENIANNRLHNEFIDEDYQYHVFGDEYTKNFELWEVYKKNEIRIILNNEISQLINDRKYFYGCPFIDYKETYQLRLTSFLHDFIDANEIDFIDFELNNKIEYKYIDDKAKLNIEYSIKLRNDFLNRQKEFLINSNNPEPLEQPTITNTNNSLNWQGTKLEFTELVKALIVANKLDANLTQTEIFKRLKQFFNVDEFNHDDKLKDIRKRTNTTTPLINILETSLDNWIKSKD